MMMMLRDIWENMKSKYSLFDPYNPITIGSYMNEPDLLNNKYQLNMAMEKARNLIVKELEDYSDISGRRMQCLFRI